MPDERCDGARDPLLDVAQMPEPHFEGTFVAGSDAHRATADTTQHRPALQTLQILAHGHRRHPELRGEIVDHHAPVGVQGGQDRLLAGELVEGGHAASAS